jgi:hypothetical protein
VSAAPAGPRANGSRRRGRNILLAVAVLGLLAVVAAGVVVNLGTAPSPFVQEPATADRARLGVDREGPGGALGRARGGLGCGHAVRQRDRRQAFPRRGRRFAQEDSIFGTNTILTGSGRALDPVVEGDLFTAEVRVKGAATYDTALGGSTVAPELEVDTITVTGHIP